MAIVPESLDYVAADAYVASINEWRAGWPVVASGAIGYGSGLGLIMITAGLFMVPMREDLGWTTSQLAVAPIVQLMSALLAPLAGYLVERWGAQAVAAAGLFGVGLGFLCMAILPSSLLILYAISFVLGLAAPLTGVVPFTSGVAAWFQRNLGTAVGVTLNGVSLLALPVIPLTSFVIAEYGWRYGYVALAAVVLGIGLPSVLIGFKERGRAHQRHQPNALMAEGKNIREVIKSLKFWALLIAFTFATFSLGGYMTHLAPILREKDYGVAQVASLAMLFAVSISVGRLVGGVLIDRYWPNAVASVLLVVAAMGGMALLYTPADQAMIPLALSTLLLGLAHGAEGDFIAFFFAKEFGMRSFTKIYSFAVVPIGISTAAGSFVFARLFDISESYNLAIVAGAAGYFLSGLTILGIGIVERMRPALLKRPPYDGATNLARSDV